MRLGLGVVLPIAIIVTAAAFPLTRYFLRDRYERQAIAIVRDVQEAQRALSVHAEGYATHLTSLQMPCGNASAVLAPDVYAQLAAIGYGLELRAARGAAIRAVDCHGHPLASDYYLSVRPIAHTSIARQALASRGDGVVYLFHDGIPPREEDIERGLPTRLDVRDSFRIP
jgi:hypothetical protein